MTKLRRSDESDLWLETRGRWRGVISDGKRTANLSCPLCGRVASLHEHEILDDGSVTPSVVCQHSGCGFHDGVVLEGWIPS